MTISASAVKDLREKTGAGMMDCKKALTESNGDFEAAADWLRKKGLAAAAKKSDRIAAEGLVAVKVSGNSGVVIELNAETDFVSKNDKFQALLANLASDFLTFSGDIESFKASNTSSTGKTVADEIAEHIAVIGENMNLRRADRLSVSSGAVVPYIHNQVAPNMGKIGALVALESDISPDKLQTLGRQLAMQVAASKPEYLNISDIDPATVQEERVVQEGLIRQSGKPEELVAKMLEGKIAKFYEQVVFNEQLFVMDGKTKIKDVVAAAGNELGGTIKVVGFKRFELGDGVEKKEENFAEEVAKAAGL